MIQGTCADMVKVAMIEVKDRIRELGLRNDVKINVQVHDQITTSARKDVAGAWRVELNDCMYKAGLFSIPTGILKADVNITDVWTK